MPTYTPTPPPHTLTWRNMRSLSCATSSSSRSAFLRHRQGVGITAGGRGGKGREGKEASQARQGPEAASSTDCPAPPLVPDVSSSGLSVPVVLLRPAAPLRRGLGGGGGGGLGRLQLAAQLLNLRVGGGGGGGREHRPAAHGARLGMPHAWAGLRAEPGCAHHPQAAAHRPHLIVPLQQGGICLHQPPPRLGQLRRGRCGVCAPLRYVRRQPLLLLSQHLVLHRRKAGQLPPLPRLKRQRRLQAPHPCGFRVSRRRRLGRLLRQAQPLGAHALGSDPHLRLQRKGGRVAPACTLPTP